jgi:DNA-binding GntR family transcriptional regulator
MGLESVPPKYAQLVTALQRRIESGQYPPGEVMPSEHQLTQEFGVSRPTVVTALRILREQGWVESRQGKGRYVRGRPVLATLEQGRAGQARLTGPETAVSGELVEAGAVAAPNRIAALLGVPQRSKVFLRRRLIRHDGEPSEIMSLWLPLELTEGTDLTSADPLPDGVQEHLQLRKGVHGDHVMEQIIARAPTTDESKMLAMSRGTPVLVVYATVREADGQPLVVLDAVLPADRHELEDAYPLR